MLVFRYTIYDYNSVLSYKSFSVLAYKVLKI